MAFAEGTPTVTIELDKPRELGYTLGAMRRAQELGVLKLDMEDDVSFMLALPRYVWACMDSEGRKDLTIETIEEMMNPLNAKTIARKMIELFKASLPPEDPSGNAEPAAAMMPTAGGSILNTSGQLVATI